MGGNNGKHITVQEALIYTGKSYSTIYRYLKKGKIKSKKMKLNGDFVTMLEKEELATVFRLPETQVNFKYNSDETQVNFSETQMKLDETHLKDAVKTVIEEYFQDRETKLMKPMEEMATYKVGKLEAQNQFLKDKLETVLQELEQYKTLPGPIEEIAEKLEIQEQTIQTLRHDNIEIVKEKESLLQEKDEEIEIIKKETASTILNVEQKKEKVIQEKETILKEKEQTLQQMMELEELQAKKDQKLQELKEQSEKSEKEEKDLLATIQALKERVQAEEKKTWWKKLIGG